MRILMIHPHDIHSPAEPWTRRVTAIAQEFVKKGHQVKLVYFLHKDGPASACFNHGYEEIALRRYASPGVFLANSARLCDCARWADIVHFQKCHHYASIPAVIAAYVARKPLHYDWDDWEERIWYESCGRGVHSRFIGFSFKALERLLPLMADTVSVASEKLRELALGFGVKAEHIVMAPVGADTAQFHPGVATTVRQEYAVPGELVLYIGQLHGAQYLDLFINAANSVLHSRPGTTFMVVGDGFMAPSLRKLTENLGIGKNFIFTGAVPRNRIPEFIAAADVCVAPFQETNVTVCKSPLKIVEYMSMGKAVVASNVGEVRRMLGGAGYLVPPGDIQAFADGITRLLSDKGLRDALGSFARVRAEQVFNWQNTASALLSLYESVVYRNSAKPLQR